VRAALEVEPETDVLAQGIVDALQGEVLARRAMTRPDYDPQRDERHDDDDDKALEKILFHKSVFRFQ
jgi:hypothetical protein